MESIKKDNRKLLLLAFFITLLIGGTFAYWEWYSNDVDKTNVSFLVEGDLFTCSADGGEPITPSNVVIMPASCDSRENVIMREINANVNLMKDTEVTMHLWLDINELSPILSASQNFRYVVTTSSTSCTKDIVISGSFNGKTAGNKIDIFSNYYRMTTNEKLYLYIWLDEDETNIDIANQSFSFSLNGTCEGNAFSVQKPVLDEGMIPVVIDDDGTVSTVSEDDYGWYNYENKKWANMVLIGDSKIGTASGNVVDLSGNGNDATYVGAPMYSNDGLVLDGNDDGILLGNILQNLFKSSNTIQMKVKRNQTGVRDIFIGNHSVSNSLNYEVTASNNYRAYVNDGSADLSIGTAAYNKYVLVTFIFDKSTNTVRIYEDSTLVGSGTSSQIGSYSYNYNSVYIGRDSRTEATSLNGTIEKVMIYNDILTIDEITQNIETNYGEIDTENGIVGDNLFLYYDFRDNSQKIREYYLNNPDTEVIESDILGYYVWIPRYKYKIWTTGVSAAGQEKPIDIVFESLNEPVSLGTQVGEYRTHPAFWWDNDNDSEYDDGEMLPGIWVGKFETTGSSTIPTVKPNVASLVNQNISNQFKTSLLFAVGSMDTSTGKVTFAGDNTYGLTDKIDSHMMKNSEWGAVAYLSHSKYGINDEIRINNYYASSKTLTGCGALTDGEAESSTCGISYGTPSTDNNTYPQSTTGNITGIFDMSGGAWEHTMTIYNNISRSSGFSIYPENKYYDLYTTFDISTACSGRICYGHALSETKSWYNDDYDFIYEGFEWSRRGGRWYLQNKSGIFAIGCAHGASVEDRGFRSVLIPDMN